MANEGYILTIEGCPYAFCTDGIENATPSHPDWSSDWEMIPNVLRNPSEYISWNERSLPIEGDLEVSAIDFELFDKYFENFTYYDGTSFTGNLLTDLFTRATLRNHRYEIIKSLVSSADTTTTANNTSELALFGIYDSTLPAPSESAYLGTQIETNYDMTAVYTGTSRTIWIEDEAIQVVGVVGAANNILQVGVLTSTEDLLGRGRYGSARKYHRIKDTYRPEIFIKHPPISKRNVSLWRVNNVDDTSETSMFPIWRGFAQYNASLTEDGTRFKISAEHKWNYYKNETLDYVGYRYAWNIPESTYSCYAMQMWWHDTLTNRRSYPAFLLVGGTVPPGITPGNRGKFFRSAQSAYLCHYALKYTVGHRFNPQTINQNCRLATEPNKLILQGVPEIADASAGSTVSQTYHIGGIQNGVEFRGPSIDVTVGGIPEVSNVTTPEIPPISIDYQQGVRGYVFKYNSIYSQRPHLPTRYINLNEFNGDYNVSIQHVYLGEDSEFNYRFVPEVVQDSVDTFLNTEIYGALTRFDKETGLPNPGSNVSVQYLKQSPQFKSAINLSTTTKTTIAAMYALLFRDATETRIFNNFIANDFNLNNIEELDNWITGIDSNGINWDIVQGTRFADFFQPYIKFFACMIGLSEGKINVVPYNKTRIPEYSISTIDILNKPTLIDLPENIWNSIELSSKNFETKFTFNDDLSKGRYRVGNTQTIELPYRVAGINSPTELASYFLTVANRFLSIWGYPQYVCKFKTDLSKIKINLGSVISITDWLIPDFDAVTPNRGLSSRKAIVIEKDINLSAGTIEFTVCFDEKETTAPYSPCARVSSYTPDGSNSILTVLTEYIKPSNKRQPTSETEFSTTEELSDYAGSNRFAYRERYNLSNPDGGVSPFAASDRVELILRNSTTNDIWSGATPNTLKVVSTDPVSFTITLDQNLPVAWQNYITDGEIVDVRFSNYPTARTTQQQEYGWIGDYLYNSLDATLPTPPALPTVRSTQYSP